MPFAPDSNIDIESIECSESSESSESSKPYLLSTSQTSQNTQTDFNHLMTCEMCFDNSEQDPLQRSLSVLIPKDYP